jgi:gamma-glutamylcyclotransferase (GGCT)/AIG2-like uncharacterized protein YtfP
MASNLFIYGTLRKEAKSHLKPSKSLGLDSVRGKIYDINGHYPGFKHGDGKVIGEIVEIDEDNLDLIDYYEGDDYKRVKITTSNGKEAWIYEYTPEVSKSKLIKSGDWLNETKGTDDITLD